VLDRCSLAWGTAISKNASTSVLLPLTGLYPVGKALPQIDHR
jgi:hypothetical protein